MNMKRRIDWEIVGLLLVLIGCLALVFGWIVIWIVGAP